MSDTMDSLDKIKSFWEKPEGTTGMIVLVTAILGGGYALFTILPIIIALLANTFIALAMLAGLGIITALGANVQFRRLIAYSFKSLMRNLTSLFITIDPIGILENIKDDVKNGMEEMSEQINNLGTQLRQLAGTIAGNEAKRVESLSMAKQAKQREKSALFILQARKAGRLQKSNLTLQQLYNKMELLYRGLRKMYEVSAVVFADMEDEIDVRTREREALLAGYSAFKNARAIMSGQTSQRELYDQTLEYLVADSSRKYGEIEEFLDVSRTFIESIDLQNGIYEEDAVMMIEDWERKSESILIGPEEKRLLIEHTQDPGRLLDLDEPLPKPEKVAVGRKPTADKYEHLLKRS